MVAAGGAAVGRIDALTHAQTLVTVRPGVAKPGPARPVGGPRRASRVRASLRDQRGVGVGAAGGEEGEEVEPVAALVEVEVGHGTAGSLRGACTNTRPYGSLMNDEP